MARRRPPAPGGDARHGSAGRARPRLRCLVGCAAPYGRQGGIARAPARDRRAARRRGAGTADRAALVLDGLLAGAVAVALLGVLVLAVSYDTAVAAASPESPARYRGFGEDPNTVPLLLGLALPLALHRALTANTRAPRAAFSAAALLFAATIVASGSRGGVLAGAVGSAAVLLLALRTARARAVAVGAVVAAAAVAVGLQALPKAATGEPQRPSTAATQAPANPLYADVERAYPLDNDVGRPLPGGGEPTVHRSVLGTSGRVAAWKGAVAQAVDRPLAGYGFGTEARVFVDRYYGFFGGLPEESYIGIALQLGIAGLLALLGLIAVLVVTARRALPVGLGPACAGVVAAGLAIALVQSYLYSVGNIGAVTFWVAAMLLVALPAVDGA